MGKAEGWVSVKQIADHIGVSKETIYRFLEKEMLPCERLGKLWRFKKSVVDAWIMQGGLDERKMKYDSSGMVTSTTP